jgi:molybdopterin converting factor small subunit
MSLATLSIDLVAQLATLQAGMDKAGRIAEKQAAQIESGYRKMTAAAPAVGAALGAALSAGAIVEFVRATVDGVDKLNDLADATGASIENLSALEDIALRTGTSIETAGSAVIKLNKALGDAKPGSPQAEAFEALGLSVEKLKKLDPVEALRQVSVELERFAGNGNKSRVVQELFGRSLAEIAPLLKDVAEAGGLNATVTRQQAEEAERFNKELAGFSKNATDAARAIAGPLVTALNGFFAELRNAKTAYGSLLSAVFDNTGPGAGGTLNERLLATARQISDIRSTIEEASTGRTAPLNGVQLRGLQSEIALLEKRERFLRLQQQDEGGGRGATTPLTRALPSLPSIGDGAGAGKPKGGRAAAGTSVGTYVDPALQDAIRALESTDTAKIERLRESLKAILSLQDGSELSPGAAQAIAAINAQIAELTATTKAVPPAEPVRAYQDALAAIADTNVSQIAALSAALDELFKLRETNLYGPEVDEAIQRLRDRLGELKKPLEQTSEFAAQAGRNIQDALGDTLLQAFEGSTSNIGKVWGDTLKRMAAQAAAAQLGKFLLGDQFGKTGNIGGAVGDLFSFLSSFGGARANGGPVRAGRPYLVGERGPEMVVPKSNGVVLPNGTALAGAGSTYQVIVQGDASENTLRLVQGALAQFEARMMMRGA